MFWMHTSNNSSCDVVDYSIFDIETYRRYGLELGMGHFTDVDQLCIVYTGGDHRLYL